MENTSLFQNNMTANPDDYLFQRKIEIMMDTNNKKINHELTDLKSNISKLNEEISILRQQLNEARSVRVESPAPIAPVSVAAVAAPATNSNNIDLDDARKNGQQLRPRFGDYKPEDVSISKFFYYGSKK